MGRNTQLDDEDQARLQRVRSVRGGEATGHQVEQQRDYGSSFWSQQWLGMKRLFGRA